MLNYVRLWRPTWSEVWNVGHKFGRGPPKDHFTKLGWDWLSSFRLEFCLKVSSTFLSIFSLAANLVGSRDHWTQFWKGPLKDHSTIVWFQLAQWCLRRRLKCEMLTDGRRTKSDGNTSHGLMARWAKKTKCYHKNTDSTITGSMYASS